MMTTIIVLLLLAAASFWLGLKYTNMAMRSYPNESSYQEEQYRRISKMFQLISLVTVSLIPFLIMALMYINR